MHSAAKPFYNSASTNQRFNGGAKQWRGTNQAATTKTLGATGVIKGHRILTRQCASCRGNSLAYLEEGVVNGGAVKGPSQGMIWLGVIALIALYLFSGIYQVDEQERGVVFRFGKVQPEQDSGFEVVPP